MVVAVVGIELIDIELVRSSASFNGTDAVDSMLVEPHVVGAQLHRLSTVDAHTDVLKPIHGKII